jgi:hypothetical protein
VIYEWGGAEVFMYPTSNAGTSKASQAFWQVADVLLSLASGGKTWWAPAEFTGIKIARQLSSLNCPRMRARRAQRWRLSRVTFAFDMTVRGPHSVALAIPLWSVTRDI